MEAQAICETSDFSMPYRTAATPATNPASWFLAPRVNEDKWFVYADGPDFQGHVRLHMHQSWSGDKMAEVIIEGGPMSWNEYKDGSTFVDCIVWESDPEQIKESSEEQAKEMAREICSWVLNVQLEEFWSSDINSASVPPKGGSTLNK
jgi:hypothetical protein